MKKDRPEPVLERLVAEARREAVPDMDWDAVESSLMTRVERERRAAPATRGFSHRPFVFAFAAAALAGVAAAAVGIVHSERSATPPAVAEAPQGTPAKARSAGPRNGAALAVGDVVEAATEQLVIEHEGQATWTLEPNSTAHVEELGSVIRVALDHGVLSARVAKSPEPESFVVRVEGTRVAVHGTAFRVVRLDHGVQVEVTEGVVGVGPLHGPSFDVAAPASTTTNFEGVGTDLRHAARSVATKTEGRTHVENASPPTEGAESAEGAGEPAAAASNEAEPTTKNEAPPSITARAKAENAATPSIDGVVEAVRRCFRERTVTNGDLHVTVDTQMSLRIQPSGRVGEAVFTPPLAPNVRRCVDDSVGGMKFPSSTNGFAVDRMLDLER